MTRKVNDLTQEQKMTAARNLCCLAIIDPRRLVAVDLTDEPSMPGMSTCSWRFKPDLTAAERRRMEIVLRVLSAPDKQPIWLDKGHKA